MTIIDDEEPGGRVELIEKRLAKWVERISLEIGAAESDVEKILRRKWLEPQSSETDVTSIRYRLEEYSALSGEISSTADSALGDFVREDMDIAEYNLPHIKAISLINKVRVVNALVGFSRIQPAAYTDDAGFVSVKEKETNWYPAYEVRGENNANARSFLNAQKVAPEKIERICEAINAVSFSQNRGRRPETLEGRIVQDADRLDALGAIGVARTFAYGGEHGRSLDESVEHFHEKLLLLKDELNTETARRLAEPRHAFLEQFLEEYERESGE